jgi:hypothetical protein
MRKRSYTCKSGEVGNATVSPPCPVSGLNMTVICVGDEIAFEPVCPIPRIVPTCSFWNETKQAVRIVTYI